MNDTFKKIVRAVFVLAFILAAAYCLRGGTDGGRVGDAQKQLDAAGTALDGSADGINGAAESVGSASGDAGELEKQSGQLTEILDRLEAIIRDGKTEAGRGAEVIRRVEERESAETERKSDAEKSDGDPRRSVNMAAVSAMLTTCIY